MKQLHSFATSRLLVIPGDKRLLTAELEGHEALSSEIGFAVPHAWPPEHHDTNTINWIIRVLDQHPASEPWGLSYLALRDACTLIGVCGFKGPPDSDGCAEVGYSVLEEYRCRGLATEAVQMLINLAFERGALSVAAETYPSLVPSLRVMQKCGMAYVGQGAEPGVVRYMLRR